MKVHYSHIGKRVRTTNPRSRFFGKVGTIKSWRNNSRDLRYSQAWVNWECNGRIVTYNVFLRDLEEV